jgi:CotS family spore coat protein
MQAVGQMARMHRTIRKMMQTPFYIRRKVETASEETSDSDKSAETVAAELVKQAPVYEQIPVEQVEKLHDITNRTRPGFIRYESEKRKSELIRARQFIRKQPCKNDFDLLFLSEFERFMEQVREADDYLSDAEYERLEACVKQEKLYCHGDCNHHNILLNAGRVYIQNLEKCRPDLQVKDLYLFVRKACEKNKWSFSFGKACIDAYQQELPLTTEELKYLYTRFYYPEKFWKIANGYMNHRKSLPPKRYKEKLETLLLMENGRSRFLKEFKTTYGV